MSVDAASPLESLTGALVDANDQLLALYDMAAMRTDSLDETESVDQILTTARHALHTDEIVLLADGADPADCDATYSASVKVEDPSGDTATLHARRSSAPFTTGDTKLLTAVANLAMSAKHTARMHAEAVERAIVSHEHDIASTLVQQTLPSDRPQLPTASLFARSDPARTAGGDLFAFAQLGPKFHFVVGDVSGKGLPAAIMMSNVINAARGCFTHYGHEGPVAVLDAIDAWVYDSLSEADLFVTLIAGQFDSETQMVSLANAGHSPVHFVHDEVATPLAASRPPVGVLEGLRCEQLDIAVTSGDRLVIASDGFPEQADESGEMFGDDRFESELTGLHAGARNFGEQLFATIESFAGNAPQSDDRTLFVLDFEGAQ